MNTHDLAVAPIGRFDWRTVIKQTGYNDPAIIAAHLEGAGDRVRAATYTRDAADRAADAAEDAADATASSGASSLEQDLARLKDLMDKGLITQQDYDAKKKELLDGL